MSKTRRSPTLAGAKEHVMATGRRQRLSAEEASERLIRAGLEALAEQGLSVGLDAVSLERAVRDAEVPRSSAYAIWSTDDVYAPQELFQRAVLRRAAEDRTSTIEKLMATSARVYEENAETMSSRELLSELIRVGGRENAIDVAHTLSWQLVIAVRAILQSGKGGIDDDLVVWMNDSEEQVRQSTIAEVYRPFVELLGLKPRPEYGDLAYQYGEIAASSLAEGLAMRYQLRANEFLDDITHPGADVEDPKWSLYSLMFEQIVQLFFEPADGSGW